MTESYGDTTVLRPSARTQAWGFVVGSVLFAIGSAPSLTDVLDRTVANVSFFAGSWFFTAGAFVQLALSGPATPARGSVAVRTAWLAAAVQLLGAILFNVSTGEALRLRTPSGEGEFVWGPSADGSVAFLISAGLAVLAMVRGRRGWAPSDRTWWSIWLNLAGSMAFVGSSAASIASPGGAFQYAPLSNIATFVGSVCFFAASVILLPSGRPNGPDRA
ncbi:hypothetical protein [Stackebrandtia soli]|uniref:hypothetical protein n=1 Tax=Stackebrandtia soli TaxID=1892856 RepID=UPI0039EAA2B3